MVNTPPPPSNQPTHNAQPTLGSLFQQNIVNPLKNFLNPNPSQNPQPEQQDINLQNLLQSLAKDELDKSAKEEQKHDNNNTAINPDNPSAIRKQIDPKKNIRNDDADESHLSDSHTQTPSLQNEIYNKCKSKFSSQAEQQQPQEQPLYQQPFQQQQMQQPFQQQHMQQPFQQQQMQQQQTFYPQMTNFLSGNQSMYGGGMGMAGGMDSGYGLMNLFQPMPDYFSNMFGNFSAFGSSFGTSGIGGFGSSGIGSIGSSVMGMMGMGGISGFGLGGMAMGMGMMGMIPPPIFF